MSNDELIMFDQNGNIRMYDPEHFDELVKAIEVEERYVAKMGEFRNIATQTMSIVKRLGEAIEHEKMKAIGARNVVESEAEERFRALHEAQVRLREKQMELDRYVAEYESLKKVEEEQQLTFQALSQRRDMMPKTKSANDRSDVVANTQSHRSSIEDAIGKTSISKLLLYGMGVRILLMVYSFFHDRYLRMKYTDIDYMIVMDGARSMVNGGSPFERATYRYTPLLAAIVLPAVLIANPIGKLIFALSDIGAAHYCYKIMRTYATERSSKLMTCVFILFNPVVINVSTRGSSDMLLTFLCMAVIVKFNEHKYGTAGAILGFATHFKLYPIIYVFPLLCALWETTARHTWQTRLTRVVNSTARSAFFATLMFTLPTLLCFFCFGWEYVDEALLHHFHREDHRHNFSPYWLLMYLNMGRRKLGIGKNYTAGIAAFIPQLVILLWVSWRLRRNIAHSFCVCTVLFVAFNKVCTVQYFVWFIPFLGFIFCEPLEGASEKDAIDRGKNRVVNSLKKPYKQPSLLFTVAAITLWSLTIPGWMLAAYALEFRGENCFGRLWIMSCVFFIATVSLAAWLGRICYKLQNEQNHPATLKH